MESIDTNFETLLQEDLKLFTRWLSLRQQWFQYPETSDQTLTALMNTILKETPEDSDSPLRDTIRSTAEWLLQKIASSALPQSKPKEMFHE